MSAIDTSEYAWHGKDKLTSREAREYMLVVHNFKRSEQTLNQWRCAGRGPRFHRRISEIYYTKADLDAFLAENTTPAVTSTSAADLARTLPDATTAAEAAE